MWELDYKESWAPKNSCFWTVVFLRVPWTARRSNQFILKEISPGCSLEALCWSWISSTLATWCEELTHLKRPWCWERLRAGAEGNDRRWDGWMASPTQWTWVWWTPGIGDGQGGLACCGSWGRRVGHYWVTEVNFTLGGHSIGASASVLPMNIQGWSPLDLTCLISLHSKGLSRVFSNTTIQKHQIFDAQPSLWSNSHICTWLLEKP